MGIPYYFYTITKRHAGIVSASATRACDLLFLDYNGIIHQAVRQALSASGEKTKEAALFDSIWRYTEDVVSRVNPTRTYICIDGVAPKAKMIQQRKRRYLTQLRSRMIGQPVAWDTNAISPGTGFMTRLAAYLANKVTSDFVLSSAAEPGEGEHKMFAMLADIPTDQRVTIYGLDADLIMLSMLSGRKQITLMREMSQPGAAGAAVEFQYLDVDPLVTAVVKDAGVDIQTYIVLCFLLGNDFIPNISALHLKDAGIDVLLAACKTVTMNGQMQLVQDGEIHMEVLGRILQELARDENTRMLERNDDYIRRRPYSQPHLDAIHCYPLQPENKDPVAHAISANPGKWRSLYYKHLFQTSLQDTRLIHIACREYIRGIQWTLAYYTRKPIDNDWYYPYGYAPTLADLANYALTSDSSSDIVKTSIDFVPPLVQLLAILPPQSAALVPGKWMTDARMSHLYPTSFKLQTYLKHAFHECHPILPMLDFGLIHRLTT